MTTIEALEASRKLILTTEGCGHALVCADPKCRAAGHDHENYGEDGWCCEHDCECLAACEGHGEDVCPASARVRDLIAHIDQTIAALTAG